MLKEIYFSIVIPLYNKEKFIGQAIESVLGQTISNFELIIVDDGSTDESVNIVKRYTDIRIRLIEKKNEGVSVARNVGIKNAIAEYIAFLDADDEWLPDFLETIKNLINKYPEAGGYATSRYQEIENSILEKITYITFKENQTNSIIENLFRFIVYDKLPITSSSVCIKKNVFETIGMFPIGVKRGEDLDMWIRLFLKYPIAFSIEAKVIIHNDLFGGSNITRGKIEKKSYVIDALEKKILLNEIDQKYINDAKKTMSKFLGWKIDACLISEEYFLAFINLIDSRMKYLPFLRVKLFIKLLVSCVKLFKRRKLI